MPIELLLRTGWTWKQLEEDNPAVVIDLLALWIGKQNAAAQKREREQQAKAEAAKRRRR